MSQQEKSRVFVLTDIENEPDDQMSLVRLLVYSNEFDVCGLAAVTSVHLKDRTAKFKIHEIIDAYSQVYKQLRQHDPNFMTDEALHACTCEGLSVYGMHGVGVGMDSEASERLIEAVDSEDERPLWVLGWGGVNVLAQALWQVKQTRSVAACEAFVDSIRVYTTSDQDDSAPWIRKTFPSLFYIVSPGFHDGGAYHFATWTGISGDHFHGRFRGADTQLITQEWLDEHVRSKGPLGTVYPETKYLMEGDTPTFLYLIRNGLNAPEHPEWGSWGGRYEKYLPPYKKYFLEEETRPFYSDATDEVLGVDGAFYTCNKATIWRFREAFQNDFAARMDWTIKSVEEANHPPVAKLDHPNHLFASPGEEVKLSAKGSYDPDGDALTYRWFYYPEAGTFSFSDALSPTPLVIEGEHESIASFFVPSTGIFRYGTIHIILEVTDQGTPPLTRYQRTIITVTP